MRKRPTNTWLLAMAAAALAVGSEARANPQGGQVVGGSAAISGQGTPGVVVDQFSDKAIINWRSFNIAPNETTRFNQPSASSTALNRVTGDKSPSSILGSLSANGRIFLVNPEGFIFGPGATINTAAFLATTHDIKNEAFLAGRYNFNIPGNPRASIVNLGSITAADTGIAALVAPAVRNEGIITARLGKVALASANGFTLDLYGDNLINFALNDEIAAQVINVATGKPLTSLLENKGKLSADGGTVAMTAVTARALVDSVINNSGVAEARSVGVQGGRIVLGGQTVRGKSGGAPKQKVVVSGTLDASGKNEGETGGKVQVTGEALELTGAMIDASGDSGGGKVLIGGDVGGGASNPTVAGIPAAALEEDAVATASSVIVDAGTIIDASAGSDGNGGKVVVWSDGLTLFDGSVLARGGSKDGDGGFVEISGHEKLGFRGHADLAAPHGERGTLLLDPLNVIIAATAGPSVITTAAIQDALATGNVVVTTGTTGTEAGDITVASSFGWNNSNSLTLDAFRNIVVSDGVRIRVPGTGSGGFLILKADSSGTGTGTVIFNPTAGVFRDPVFSSRSSVVRIYYNPAGGYLNPTDYSPFGGSAITAYMLVNNLLDLQNIQTNLSSNYALGRDIDASGSEGLNNGAGFIPIAIDDAFTNHFDGQNHTISNLTINSSEGYVGLFGRLGAGGRISNVGLENLTVVATASSSFAGAFAGWTQGTISNSFVTGSISGGAESSVGGLVGEAIGNCQGGLGSVTCSAPFPTILDSYSTASVTGGPSSWVGGLIGRNPTGGAQVSRSYAAGPVTGGADSQTGGLLPADAGSVFTPGGSSRYWDTEATGQNSSGGGVGLTTAQLKSGLPSGFGPTVWGSDGQVNEGYPFLLWQANPSPSGTILTPIPPALITLYYVANPVSNLYGSAIPIPTGTVIGFVNGDTLETATTGTLAFSTAVVPSTDVGSYEIIGSGLTAIGNYVFAQDPSNAMAFTVTPAPLTITADDATKQVGTTLGFTGTEFTSSGLLFSDTVTSVTLTSAGAPAGATVAGSPYPIIPSNAVGTGLDNYSITYVNGELTVGALPPPPPPPPPTAQRPPNDPFALGQVAELGNTTRITASRPTVSDNCHACGPTTAARLAAEAVVQDFLKALHARLGPRGVLDALLARELTTLLTLALPDSLIFGDPNNMLLIREWMVERLNEQMVPGTFAHAVKVHGELAIVNVFASVAAEGVARLLKIKNPELGDDSWQVSTVRLWVKIGIVDGWIAIKTNGNPYAVAASTAGVAIAEIYGSFIQTIPVVTDVVAAHAAQQRLINRVLEQADARQFTDPAAAQRLRDQAAGSQQSLLRQKSDFWSISTLNPFN